MTGFCPYKKGSLKESECHHDGYCSECPHNTKDDTISRQAAIDAVVITPKEWDGMYIQDLNCRLRNVLSSLPSAQPDGWLEQNKDKILQAGMEGREIDFRIGGRLFAIREKAQ